MLPFVLAVSCCLPLLYRRRCCIMAATVLARNDSLSRWDKLCHEIVAPFLFAKGRPRRGYRRIVPLKRLAMASGCLPPASNFFEKDEGHGFVFMCCVYFLPHSRFYPLPAPGQSVVTSIHNDPRPRPAPPSATPCLVAHGLRHYCFVAIAGALAPFTPEDAFLRVAALY